MKRQRRKIYVFLERPTPVLSQQRRGETSSGRRKCSGDEDLECFYVGSGDSAKRRNSAAAAAAVNRSASRPLHASGSNTDSSSKRKLSVDAAARARVGTAPVGIRRSPSHFTTSRTAAFNNNGMATRPTTVNMSEPTRMRTKVAAPATRQHRGGYSFETTAMMDDDSLSSNNNKENYTITLRFEVAPEPPSSMFDVQTAGVCLSPPNYCPPPPPTMPPPIPPRIAVGNQPLNHQLSAEEQTVCFTTTTATANDCLNSYGATTYAQSNCFGSGAYNPANGGGYGSNAFGQPNCSASNGFYPSAQYPQQQSATGPSGQSYNQYDAGGGMNSLGMYGASMNCGSQPFGYNNNTRPALNNPNNDIGCYGANNFSSYAFNSNRNPASSNTNNSLGNYMGYNNNISSNFASNGFSNYAGSFGAAANNNGLTSTLDDYMGFGGAANYAAAGYPNTVGDNMMQAYGGGGSGGGGGGHGGCNCTVYYNSYQTSSPPIYCQHHQATTIGFSNDAQSSPPQPPPPPSAPMNLGTYNYLDSIDNMRASAQANPFYSHSSNTFPASAGHFYGGANNYNNNNNNSFSPSSCQNIHNNYGPYSELITVPYGTGNLFVNQLLNRRFYNNDQFYDFNLACHSGLCHFCCSPQFNRGGFGFGFGGNGWPVGGGFSSNAFQRMPKGQKRKTTNTWRKFSPYVNLSVTAVRSSPRQH